MDKLIRLATSFVLMFIYTVLFCVLLSPFKKYLSMDEMLSIGMVISFFATQSTLILNKINSKK